MSGHEAGRLQGLLHEGVAEAHVMLPTGELMEVADIEPLIPIPVERQQPLEPSCSNFHRIRRMLWGLRPRMSAAWSHVSWPVRARTMTSCTFMARSTVACG